MSIVIKSVLFYPLPSILISRCHLTRDCHGWISTLKQSKISKSKTITVAITGRADARYATYHAKILVVWRYTFWRHAERRTVGCNQSFKDTLTAVRERKIAEQQPQRLKFYCEGELLENVFKLEYLGSVLSVDGLQIFNIRELVDRAMVTKSTCLTRPTSDHWSRSDVAAGVSLHTYGCES